MVDINQLPTRRPFFRRRKSDPLSGADAPPIDYKDVRLLQRYVSSAARSCRRGSRRYRRRSSANWPERSNAPDFSAFSPM